MAPARFSMERTIPAAPEALYALLADYREGHPGILPPAFSDYAVLEGGVGAGTHIRFQFTVAGRPRSMEGRVSEPEPGRVLEETYADGSITRFIVDPAGQGSHLRIETDWDARGLTSFVERLLVPRLLGPIYREELDLIAAWARGQGPRDT